MSQTHQLEYPGLPQGSPLAPLLYIFINAGLVDTPITRRRGAIGFIDDYSRWVTGESADRNIAVIQDKIIPRAMKWAADTGATFDPKKTALIHFTRAPNTKIPRPQNAVSFMGVPIAPAEQVKLLGVIFDPELRFQQHAVRAATRGIKQAFALSRLKGLRPRAARQLYLATVTSRMDYAASVWYHPSQRGSGHIIKRLDQVQRLGCKAILGAFRTVSLAILEAEVGVDPTYIRLQKRLLRHFSKLYTLPKDHPLWPNLSAVPTHPVNRQFKSPLANLKEIFSEVCHEPLELIAPFCVAPWTRSLENDIEIPDNREAAIKQASELPYQAVKTFTDGSGCNSLLGIGAVHVQGSVDEIHWQMSNTIDHTSRSNIYLAELGAILEAVRHIQHIIDDLHLPLGFFYILSDSQSALKVLQNPQLQSGQSVIKTVIHSVNKLYESGFRTHFQWVPAHAGIKGNEAAHQQAIAATIADCLPNRPDWLSGRLITAAIRCGKDIIEKLRIQTFNQSSWGTFTRQLDGALPQRHAIRLYQDLSREDAQILVQLRSGHSRLASNLFRMNIVDSNQCDCGQGIETIRHFLFDCQKWYNDRNQLRQIAGPRWGDLSYMLGGWSDLRDFSGRLVDGRKDHWKPNCTVIKAVISFVKKTGRINLGIM
jgi:ribonuclease HI